MKKSLSVLLVMMLLLSFAWTVSATDVTATAAVNGTEVTVSGTITGGVSNQQITIMVVKGGVARATATESDIAYINQETFTGGSYSFTFEMPDSMTTGTYDAYIGGTGVSPAVKVSFTLGSATEAPTQAPSGATVTGTTDVDTTKYTVTATANGEPVAITIANGTYTIELPAAGNYTIAVSAPTAITYSFSVTEAQGTQIEGPAINLITGDFSGDGYITGADITALMSNIGAVNDGSAAFKQMDLSGDGYITGADITALMAKIGSSY
jgi:hypothetical protein